MALGKMFSRLSCSNCVYGSLLKQGVIESCRFVGFFLGGGGGGNSRAEGEERIHPFGLLLLRALFVRLSTVPVAFHGWRKSRGYWIIARGSLPVTKN